MSVAAPAHTSRSRRIAISAGALAVLLGALDTYVVVTIIRDIMSDVGIAVNQIQRVTPIVTGYLLGYIAAMPLLGRASDRFGRKMLLQVSLAGFAIGSIITAMSTDLTMLVVGRVIQGSASGALLPVTLALAADLWAARNRAGVLGGIGAAQELGSVLGPMYGIALVFLFHHWQAVFWVNVPLAVIAMVMVHFSLPKRLASEQPEKVDVTGGVLLAITLGLIVVGMYNPAPDGKQVLPSYGPPLVIAALVAAVAFFSWERFAKTRLIEPAGVHFRPFLAALGASLTAGAALMVTLVNVELFGQGVLGQDQNQAAFLLLRFLIALPIGALLGGWIATKVGDRAVACVGLLIAAGGYYLIAQWPIDLLSARHDLGFIKLPLLDTDLAIAGFGLGLVIGPLTSATLRVVPSVQHGIASAAVVVSRMIGMLVGIAALSAWGLYRFNQILQSLPATKADTLAAKLIAEGVKYRTAFAMQYGEMFSITAIVCVVGAVLALFISGRNEHAD
ncbi:MAG: MFS transporter, partial [Mycobacterium sp.]